MRLVLVIAPRTQQDIERMRGLDLARDSIIEWRADDLSLEQIATLSPFIRGIFDGYELLLTIRSQAEGGRYLGDDEAYQAHLREAYALVHPDYLDVEWVRGGPLLEELQDRTLIILSYHDWTSHVDVVSLARRMQQHHPFMVKIAVLVESQESAVDLIETTKIVTAAYPDQNFTIIGMGEPGRRTRLMGDETGSKWAYTSLDGRGAPGQIPLQVLQDKIRKEA